jgi:hypothetical protein
MITTDSVPRSKASKSLPPGSESTDLARSMETGISKAQKPAGSTASTSGWLRQGQAALIVIIEQGESGATAAAEVRSLVQTSKTAIA